ncbi:MAG: type II toxin-antitoxin system HicA family toxin [Candidatus Eremiobacteraeota bacterium]|nr:type II toxin-antitoxin system HicA family toxin [Candidatus Eremiobacteraeota bacterium]
MAGTMHPHKRRAVVRFLKSLGFLYARRNGPHDVFQHPDGRLTYVPRGSTIRAGTSRDIAKEINMPPQLFDKLVGR